MLGTRRLGGCFFGRQLLCPSLSRLHRLAKKGAAPLSACSSPKGGKLPSRLQSCAPTGFSFFFSRLFPSAPAGHLYTGGPRMCLGGIKGAAFCIPAAHGCAAHRPGKRAVARGQDQPARCRAEAGCHLHPPLALQSSGPAACLRRDEAKAVMAAWVSWADHLATRAPTTLGRSRAGASSARARAKDRMKEAAPSLPRPPRLQARPTGICAHARALGRPAPCDGAPRRGQHQRLDPRAERAGPGLTRARQGLCLLQVAGPLHSGRPLATTSSRLSSTRST